MIHCENEDKNCKQYILFTTIIFFTSGDKPIDVQQFSHQCKSSKKNCEKTMDKNIPIVCINRYC